MTVNRKDQIRKLLKGIETGDPASLSVVNEDNYTQHNPQTPDGAEGLAELYNRLSETTPKVKVVRMFEDADFVFAHTEYDFAEHNIGFEIFRFEGGQAVEHWDNIQKLQGPNPSGHTMIDGSTEVTSLDKTESNRLIIRGFVENVLIKRNGEKLYDYIKWNHFVEHNPRYSDDLDGIMAVVSPGSVDSPDSVVYQKCHKVLAEGNFALSVCEGSFNRIPTAFYDLYRLEHDWIVEHWDTVETIPPLEEWKNDNGKF